MRLRTNLRAPVRYEGGEEEYSTMKQNKVTKPAYPDLLRKQMVPFNNSNGNAAFPSLPLSGVPNLLSQSQDTSTDQILTSGHSDRSPAPSVTSKDESTLTARAGSTFTGRAESPHSEEAFHSRILEYDDFDEFELRRENSEVVVWTDLELSTQYQIFTRLLGFHNEDAVGSLLKLSEEEFVHVQQAIKRRRETPFADAELWKYLQTGVGVDPELIDRYYKDLTFDESYNEAYPVSFQRAAVYLEQLNLTPALLGNWCLRQDDSGMLTCIDPSVASVQAKTQVLEHENVSSAEILASGAAASQQARPLSVISATSKPSTKRQRQPSPDSIDKAAQTQIARPRKAPRKKTQPSDPIIQVPAPMHLPAIGPSNRPREAPDQALQVPQPPMLHQPVIKKHARPHAIHTERLAVAAAPDTPISAGSSGQPVCNDHRSAGEITLRDRSRLQPTKRGEKMMETPASFSDPSESDEESFELAASPSSPFVTLHTRPVPKLKVNLKTGRAEVSSSPSAPSPSNECQKVYEGPSMEHSPLSRNRSLPPNAAEAIVEERRRSSVASQSTDVTTTSSEPTWKYPHMMHDPSLYTPCFQLMPKQDRERLLEIHPARRNIVQTWLIYGVEAWNKHRLWNSKFPETQHYEPAPREQWLVNKAGPVIGRSMARQWNWCQALGLSHNVFADEKIGELIIKGFDTAQRAWVQITAGAKKLGLSTPDQDPTGHANKKFHAACDHIQAQLWQEIKTRYMKYLTTSLQDQLNKKPTDEVILFNFKRPPQLEQNSSVVSPTIRQSKPTQTFVKSNDNAFTSKALGLGDSEEKSTMAKTPDSQNLGFFAQNSTERQTHPRPSPICSPNDLAPLQHRGASNKIQEETFKSDTEAMDLSPSVRRQTHLAEIKRTLQLNREAALPTPRTSTGNASTSGLRKPSLESPAFSPINQEEVSAFFHASVPQSTKDANQEISAPEKSLIEGQEAQHQDPQLPPAAPANIHNEDPNTTTDNNQPKTTKIRLNLSPNATAHINPPTATMPAPTPKTQPKRGRSLTRSSPLSSTSAPHTNIANTSTTTKPTTKPKPKLKPRQSRSSPTNSRTTRAQTTSRNSTPSTNTRSQTPGGSLLSQSVLNATSRSHAAGLLPTGPETIKKAKPKTMSRLQVMTDAGNDADAATAATAATGTGTAATDNADADPDAEDELSTPTNKTPSPAITTRAVKANPITKTTPKAAVPKKPRGPRGPYKSKKTKKSETDAAAAAGAAEARRAEELAAMADYELAKNGSGK